MSIFQHHDVVAITLDPEKLMNLASLKQKVNGEPGNAMTAQNVADGLIRNRIIQVGQGADNAVVASENMRPSVNIISRVESCARRGFPFRS
jgi:hypothetical protein